MELAVHTVVVEVVGVPESFEEHLAVETGVYLEGNFRAPIKKIMKLK